MAATATQTNILKLTVGMFDAAPGADFLSQFEATFAATGSIKGLAAALAGTSAFQGIYADSLSNNAFATAFIDNLVGTEADAAAKAWAVSWIEGQLNAGASRSDAMVTAIEALSAVDPADATWGNAQKALTNQTKAAEIYSITEGKSSTDLATLKGVTGSVTSDPATVPTPVTGKSFTLTDDDLANVDADTVVGTDKNDVITGTSDQVDAGDVIIDQSSTDSDTLNITADGNIAAARIEGIEVINVSTETVADITADLDNVSGAKEINVTRKDLANGQISGKGTVDLDNVVGAATTTIAIGAGVDDAEVNFDANGSAGTITTGADLETLAVSNVGKDGVTITAAKADADITVVGKGDTDADGVANDQVTLSVAGKNAISLGSGNVVENLTLSGNGAATESTITGDVESITLTGSQDITVVATAAVLTTEKLVNDSTGKVKLKVGTPGALDLSNAAVVSEVELDGNYGNNTVTVNSGQLITTASDQTGNPLTIAAAKATATDNTVTLSVLDNKTANNGFDADDLVFTNFATVNLKAEAEKVAAVDLTAGTATVNISGTQDVAFSGAITAKTINAADLSGALSLTLTNTDLTSGAGADKIVANSTTNRITANLGDGANELTITTAGSASLFTMGKDNDTVSVAETKAIVVNTGAGDDEVTVSVAADAVISAGEGKDTLIIDGAGDLDVSAKTNFAATGFEVVSLADGLEVSLAQFAAINAVEVQGSAAKVLTVNGTTAADTIDLSNLEFKVGTTSTTSIVAGDGDDTIKGSDTADLITGGAGNDTITGGTGEDTFVVTNVTAGGTDIITDFTNADVIKFANAATYDDLTANDYSGQANVAAAANAALVAAGNGAAQAASFTYDSRTYIVIDGAGFDAYAAGSDAIVDVTGISTAAVAALTAADFIA